MQPVEEAVNECSFPRADFTDKRNEAFAILDAIHQPAQRFFDLFGKKEVARIWIDVERILFQPEKALIHILMILTNSATIIIQQTLDFVNKIHLWAPGSSL